MVTVYLSGLPLSPRNMEESPRLTRVGGSKMGQCPGWSGDYEVTWYLVSPPPPVSWSRHEVGLGEKVLFLSDQVRGGCQRPLGKAYTHAAMCMCVRTAHVHTHLGAQTMPCMEGGEDCALFTALFP